MRRFVTIVPGLIVLAAAALTLLAAPRAFERFTAARIAAAMTVAQQSLDDDDLLERINQATRAVAAAVEPTVVFIEGSERSGRSRAPRQTRSTGSGWLYDDRGHIVTNAHVVFDPSNRVFERLRVQFYDGRVREAQFIGADRSTDIAVLRVQRDDTLLFPSRLATGSVVHQGDRVFAFGAPFGLKFSMSEGVVSGVGRFAQTVNPNAYTNFIQTDAAINPGNSGGPLVDVNGRVVGMNTAIITNGDAQNPDAANRGVSGGIGFAIPLETIESVVGQLIEHGVVIRGYLGVEMDDDRQGAVRAGYDGQGVRIEAIQENLPAARSGIKPGDVITHVEGSPSPSLEILRTLIGVREPGEAVTFTIWREGDTFDLDVELGAARIGARGELVVLPNWSTPDAGARLAIRQEITEALGLFGIAEIADNPREGARGNVRQPQILKVVRNSLAERARFQPGYYIVSIENRPVRDTYDALDTIAQIAAPDNRTQLTVEVVDPRTNARERLQLVVQR